MHATSCLPPTDGNPTSTNGAMPAGTGECSRNRLDRAVTA